MVNSEDFSKIFEKFKEISDLTLGKDIKLTIYMTTTERGFDAFQRHVKETGYNGIDANTTYKNEMHIVHNEDKSIYV